MTRGLRPLLAVGLAIAVGCAEGEAIEPGALHLEQPEPEADPAEPEALPELPTLQTCVPIVFTLGDGVPEDVAMLWLGRWSQTTGCALGFGFGGIPIEITEGLTSPDEAEPRGMTTIHEGACTIVELDAESWVSRTLGHELGHCLGAYTHSASGVMAQASRDEVIDAPTLEVVCEHLACRWMRPEGATASDVGAR